ncbi:hypothetical protein BC939DRAFT_477235 [Gamsiella multidivaricata]|uniref:uncharacterized protein n=1 Tax=Gamsiella multidivaricata TaxID=101098 RepID=UPI00221F604F|nr:uncharacterized protein BC939DRAFT_477235 [Gamsiella multidivaricata]KAI7823335.1 hypothetical protein BC939DRAFT_477235 [Gamsiella multidivaricata]
MFRKFNKWKISRSEVSWTASVIVPILEEFMFVQHERQLNHISWQATQEQPYQPDVIGLADEGKTEVYYGEIKVAKAGLEEQHTDRLRLIIFSKDALDLFERTLDTTPPVISAQVVGRQAVFYYAVKIGNTILHCKLSSFSMPVTLGEFNLHDVFFPFFPFFPLFQVQSLTRLAKEGLDHKRQAPLATVPFPTMGTPSLRIAMNKNN